MSTLETALANVLDARLRGLFTAMPGRVQSYDPATQTVDVEPMIVPTVPESADEDAGDTETSLPVLMNVPILFQRAGAFALTFPIARGDSVLLVFAQHDLGRWRSTGERRRPLTSAQHAISGAVAIPGLYPSADALSGVEEGAAFLGVPGGFGVRVTEERAEVGGASDAAALSSRIDAVIDAFVNAVPVGTDGGAALQTAVKTVWAAMETTASDRLKLDG